MAETIWSAVVTGYNFIMDNLVIINMILALVIIFFREDPADGLDLAAPSLFYPDPRIYPLSDYRAGFPQEQDVQGKGD